MPRGPRKPRLKVRKEAENDDIVVVRHNEVRPSSVAIAKLAPPVLVNRPPIPEEPTFMYRIYRETAQRAHLHYKTFNTNAAYIAVSDREKLVFVWEGQSCSETDKSLAILLAVDVMKRDLNLVEAKEEDILHVVEGKENHLCLLELLKLLGFDEASYRSKIARVERTKPLEDNLEIVVGTIESFPDGSFGTNRTGHLAPDGEGIVPRINFPPIQTVNTITFSQIGQHWDLWISRGVSSELERDVKTYVCRLIVEANKYDPDMDELFAMQYIHIVRQGCERVLFRRQFKIFTDYEPPDRSLPWIPPQSSKGRSGDFADGENNAALYDALQLSDAVDPAVLLSLDHESSLAKKRVDPYKLPVPEFAPIEEAEPEDEPTTSPGVLKKGFEGRQNITREMLEFHEELCVTPAERIDLLREVTHTPRLLMGWQIEIDEGRYQGIHVVTGVRKNLFQKSLFRLSDFEDEDQWCRLRRGPKKNGVVFRPLRKVWNNENTAVTLL